FLLRAGRYAAAAQRKRFGDSANAEHFDRTPARDKPFRKERRGRHARTGSECRVDCADIDRDRLLADRLIGVFAAATELGEFLDGVANVGTDAMSRARLLPLGAAAACLAPFTATSDALWFLVCSF